jgi:tRNA pseudouridine55 synthase
MQGILLVDKPSGWTSFDVVNYVRKLARQAALVESYKVHKAESGDTLDFQTFKLSTRLPKVKVGHTGTLDPLATGLLVLLVGKEYTRKATELTKLDKTYEVTMKLGETSTTGDEEGEKTVTFHALHLPPDGGASRSGSAQGSPPRPADAPFASAQKAVHGTVPGEKAVLEALESLQGHIMQTPPVYSAMKINGQRAYKLARAGKEVALEARPVTIYKNELTSYDYPYVKFTSDVGSGTYIRSLVEDLGKLLKTGAYMSDLRRTRVGQFDIQGAITIEGLTEAVLEKSLQPL